MPSANPLKHANERLPCKATARRAGLHYVDDERPGIKRIRVGKGLRYHNAHGKPVTDLATLDRIRKLAIPPAWTHVWICPTANGHLQATGRDARGRKQYRYHERWRAVRDEDKFDRLTAFAETLPRIRRRVRRDLKLPGLPREKVLATVVQLLETTLIRVGNEEYATTNHSFGLTTFRDPHVRIRKGEIRFEFRGKGGKWHCITLNDRRLAQIVKRCQDIPGQELFQYLDENNKRHPIRSTDVNAYLEEVGGAPFTAKDFRTWSATLLAARSLREACAAAAASRRRLLQCIKEVACKLGNTAAVCRKSYIHPALLDAYLDGSLESTFVCGSSSEKRTTKLSAEESAMLAWLRARLRSRIPH